MEFDIKHILRSQYLQFKKSLTNLEDSSILYFKAAVVMTTTLVVVVLRLTLKKNLQI